MDNMTCPGCSGQGECTDQPGLLQCTRCGGLFGTITVQLFRKVVRYPMVADGERVQYVDVMVGGDRWHGWVDTVTRHVVQEG